MKDDMSRITGIKGLKSGSHYQRLIRFFEGYSATGLFLDLLLWALTTVIKEVDNFFLDSTEWKIGSFELHILVLAAQVNGIAIPVYFKVYKHKGVLSERERVNFIRKALKVIDLEVKLLVADREFIGKEWLSSLIKLKVNFIIRLRKKMYQSYIESSGYSYEKLEKKALKKGYSQAIFEMEGGCHKIEMWKSTIQVKN
jgi:hypothetical protein